MIKKVCNNCKKKYKCEGECNDIDRITGCIRCLCGSCIMKSNWADLEGYKSYHLEIKKDGVFCRSRFRDTKEKVIFT